jgi:hypothetical protein
MHDNDKLTLTNIVISELKLANDKTAVRKYHAAIWKNIRNTSSVKMRLTEVGFRALKDRLNLKTYQIDLQKIELTNQILLNLDKYMEGPYYLDKDSITVFREKTAIELILYEGNLKKFVSAKLSCKEKNIKNII